ncbi:MAG: transcription-repair coupling factor [Clostridia bacterium]|nr:transcription-repair coupling factor [Clostridia bacterium]
MKFLENYLKKEPAFKSVVNNIQNGFLPISVSGLSQIHKSVFVGCVAGCLQKTALIITPDEPSATEITADIIGLGYNAVHFPARDFCFTIAAAQSKEYEYKRLDTLSKILGGHFSVAVCSAEAALQCTVPPNVLKQNSLELKTAQTVNLEWLTEKLICMGYVLVPETEGQGQFSRRGGILDVFAVNTANPVRIEFWGDEIDSMSEFDISSQRRTHPIENLNIIQAGEIVTDTDELIKKLNELMLSGGLTPEQIGQISQDISLLNGGVSVPLDRYLPLIYPTCTIFDYLKNTIIFVAESSKIAESLEGIYNRQNEDYIFYLEKGCIFPNINKFTLNESEFYEALEKAVYLENFTKTDYNFNIKEQLSFSYKRLPPWKSDVNVLLEDTQFLLKNKGKCLVLAGGKKAAEVVCNSLNARGVKATLMLDELPDTLPNGITVTKGGLSAGFQITAQNFMLVTCYHIFGGNKKVKLKRNENSIGSLDELKAGDYVVHSMHGIGVFAGINKINNKGVIKDYIKINYAKTDVLYVPVTQLDLISKYVGATENGTVKLNRLGNQDWQKTRARVKKAVKEMAKELTALYAKRMSVKGYAFSADTQLQADFEAAFPFAETADQIRSTREIKADMERPVPMDRLLCGDVGFGKTEVALRAAFKCISEGKQCAFLVPTTILAYQHYNTVLRRFSELPLNVKMLSRFVTASEQKKVIEGLKNGKIDMVIGTHRLISGDINFKNIGLVIIDEEQRFGVAQKEKLKQLYPFVDVLTLSATPIPRTLNMAMSGLRDMSTIEEAPGERLPVQTYVLEQNWAVITEALKKELRRSGQAYYLHNKTEDIELCAAKIKELLPEANVAVAHGKMSEEELSRVWQRLVEHEIDILVCTTIIETGVDVPNANTLIVENSDRLGLSQLHQIRGRVGRSARRAYAYFCFNRGRQISEVAEKRLEAIREYTEFGSGFKIAMRDLQIRGAGNILGGEQHGNLEAVGYDMYIRLLNEAVNEQNGIAPKKEYECTVDLNISAHIPERYIESLPARLGIYKRIAAVSSNEQKLDVLDELIDRFGTPPKSVIGLIDIALLRSKAANAGIYEICEEKDGLVLKVKQVTQKQIDSLMPIFEKRVFLSAGESPYYKVSLLKKQSVPELISEIAAAL